jgi:Outer membrane protein beta-barrel domain
MLQKYLKKLLVCALIFSFAGSIDAQQRFSAKLIAGLTASQIDGDVSAGYHKVGLQGGLGVATRLKGKQSASVEMLFTQRGCTNQPQVPPYFTTTLNYVEVPVQWHYSDWLMDEDGQKNDWYRVQFNGGLTYGRLISYLDKYPDGAGISSALEDLNKNSVCLTLGASLYFTRHLGLTFRYNRALQYLYKPGNGGNYSRSLYEHFLAFQLNYRL